MMALITPFLPYIFGAVAILGALFGLKLKWASDATQKEKARQAKDQKAGAELANKVEAEINAKPESTQREMWTKWKRH